MIPGFRREVGENCVLLGSYAGNGGSTTRWVTAQKNAVLKSCI